MHTQEPVPSFSISKILLPVLIGFGISVYLITSNFQPQALRAVSFSGHLLFGLGLAALAVVLRDAAYMWRIREITGRKLSWRKSFDVIMLWEFGSAITPGAVGGIALALFILRKEGISYGRSTATIMLTTFFDNAAFVFVFGLLYWLVGPAMFAVSTDCPDVAGNIILQGISTLADKSIIGWVLYAGSALFFGLALFIMPHRARIFFHAVSRFKWLQSWSHNIKHLGDEIEITAREFKQMNAGFYLQMIVSTLIAWVSRYLLANALLYAFASGNLNQLEILARQYVLWVFVVIPSTPGASGLAEFSFIAMNCAYIQTGLAAAVAVIWRMYSYYLYLLVGVLVLPKWLQRTQ